MQYDTFGRIVQNYQSDVGTWQYVWDAYGNLLGTGDQRGCGENYFYDDDGRLIAEDYSPCTASQTYTSPDLATGDGTEVFYKYDTYEDGPLDPETGDAAANALGHLVSVQDRGAHRQFHYDVRGRVIDVSSQMATPNPSPTISTRYDPHWYDEFTQYDDANRPINRIANSNDSSAAFGGATAEGLTYDARGFLTSSYGIASVLRNASGQPTQINYRDAAQTQSNLTYDYWNRLSTYSIGRVSPPSGWGYLPPDTTQTDLAEFSYGYDNVNNLTSLIDSSAGSWPAGALTTPSTQMQYDENYRIKTVTKHRRGLADTFTSPNSAEYSVGNNTPFPLATPAHRVANQTFTHDWNGNIQSSTDDANAFFDRSLGTVTTSASIGLTDRLESAGSGLSVHYDDAGNMTDVMLLRGDSEEYGAGATCAQRFIYDWDEVGQLSRARRYDFQNSIPVDDSWPNDITDTDATVDMDFAYSQGARVRKHSIGPTGEAHVLDVSTMLRIEQATFDGVEYSHDGLVAYYSDGTRQLDDDTLPEGTQHEFIPVGDHLGSSSFIIDKNSGELVEKTTYHPYGAVESDYRPPRWNAHREDYKFTAHEDDNAVGLTYFGARYYSPYMGRFISPDPLTIHAAAADPNPYAYVDGHVFGATDPFGLDGVATIDLSGGGVEVSASDGTFCPPSCGGPKAPSPAVVPFDAQAPAPKQSALQAAVSINWPAPDVGAIAKFATSPDKSWPDYYKGAGEAVIYGPVLRAFLPSLAPRNQSARERRIQMKYIVKCIVRVGDHLYEVELVQGLSIEKFRFNVDSQTGIDVVEWDSSFAVFMKMNVGDAQPLLAAVQAFHRAQRTEFP